ncbi:MAG: hypothetical protein OXC14_12440 [Rhodospirillaceae bacterium]|nr:hypothetical protein [Rhodospirillaceae bacterium]
MTEIEVGELTFGFPEDCEATKYDEWQFYRKKFQSIQDGTKAVDIVCVVPDEAWLIEVKDYRKHERTKPSEIADEVAAKVRDTLSGLAAASANAEGDDEKRIARRALRNQCWRVALHLEQTEPAESALWQRPIDNANVLLKLRGKLRSVDAEAIVVNVRLSADQVPWAVA